MNTHTTIALVLAKLAFGASLVLGFGGIASAHAETPITAGIHDGLHALDGNSR